MRQRLLLIGIASALILGGWSGVLASVLCPHAGRVTVDVAGDRDVAVMEAVEVVVVATSVETHDCCRIKLRRGAASAHDAMPDRHASRPTSHDRHATIQSASHDDTHAVTPPASSMNEQAAAATGDDTAADTETCDDAATRYPNLDAPASECAHCMSRSEPPPATASAREASNARRDSTAAASRAAKMHAPPASSFIPATFPQRRAPPPGSSTRRHVLNSIFLI